MKKCKKLLITAIFVSTILFIFTACENNTTKENASASANSDNGGQSWLSPGKFGSTDNTIAKGDNTTSTAKTEESTELDGTNDSEHNEADVDKDEATTGTKSEEDGTTAGNDSKNEAENNVDDGAEKVENAGEKLAEDVESLVDDVADGIGDAIDNLGGGSFDAYEDAKEYLLGKLQEDNAAANYEFREEVEELTAYNSNDSGAEAYRFSVYETDGNEKIGIYYVDKDTGKIYRYMGKNSIEAY